MNKSEAKEVLSLYRAGLDDADPQFAEALAQVARDPQLADWLGQQGESYRAIRSKLREIDAPKDLREKIVRERPIPFDQERSVRRILELAAAIVISVGITAVALNLWQRERNSLVQGQEIVVKGEVLDMTCYIAHNLSGPQHAQCARDCIRKGLPVGIKGEDGKVYLLVGKTKPVNSE